MASDPSVAEGLIRAGKPREALRALTEQVRSSPADPKLRMFLSQIAAVLGDWDRALTQVSIAAEMDAKLLLPAQLTRQGAQGEALRAEVFAGRRLPSIFGEPAEWMSWLVQANQRQAQGDGAGAADLRARALEEAPAESGRIDGRPFAWLMDADARFGPMLEAFIDGNYCWLPLSHVAHIRTEAPGALIDIVWLPASVTLRNGGHVAALLPVRYEGSEKSADDAVLMARKTDWRDGPGGNLGLGQRLLAGDAEDCALLEAREIAFDAGAAGDGAAGGEPRA